MGTHQLYGDNCAMLDQESIQESTQEREQEKPVDSLLLLYCCCCTAAARLCDTSFCEVPVACQTKCGTVGGGEEAVVEVVMEPRGYKLEETTVQMVH